MFALKSSNRHDETDYSRDPAPSRIRYRMTRLWLSPRIRMFVTTILPVTLSILVAGLWIGHPDRLTIMRGWTEQARASVEARPEFQIRQMAVTGASPELTDAVRARLDMTFPVSWFDLDPDVIHDKVTALDAVATADVSLELGKSLNIAIAQREPAIIWRNGGALFLLDGEGHRIAGIDRREGLPELHVLTGRGADRAVPEALALFAAAQPVEDRLRGLARRGERRWDVVLDRDQTIFLPETGAVAALERVLATHDAMDLLNRDVPVIDMRNPDRPTVRLGSAAVDYLRVTRAFEQGLKQQ